MPDMKQTANLMLKQYRSSLPTEVGELKRQVWIDRRYTFVKAHVKGEQVTFQFKCRPGKYGTRRLIGILLPAIGKDDIRPAQKLYEDNDLSAELSRCDIRPRVRVVKERGRRATYV